MTAREKGETPMTLTKNEIIENISDKAGFTKVESKKVVEELFGIIKDELAKGNPVKISGFGKWTVLNKKARRGRNPKTGEEMTIDARKAVTFKASAALRDGLILKD